MARRSAYLSYLIPFSIFVHQAIAQTSALDFANYPTTAKACLVSAATSSKCDITVVATFNSCVCSNGGNFVTNAVQCLSTSDAGDLSTVYGTMASNCADSKTPLQFTLQQFLALGTVTTTSQTTTTTTTSASTVSGTTAGTTLTSVITTTATSTPTNTALPSGGGSKSGLSIGAIVGIAVGAALLFAIIGVIAFILWRRRRNNINEHNDPIANYPSPAPTGPTLVSHGHTSSVTDSTYDPKFNHNRYSNMTYSPAGDPSVVGQTHWMSGQQQYTAMTPSPGQGYVEPYGQPQELAGSNVGHHGTSPQELPGSHQQQGQGGGYMQNMYPYGEQQRTGWNK